MRDAPWHAQDADLALAGGVPGADVRSCGSEHKDSALLSGLEPGHFLGLIGHAILLLEGGIVLLVQDDEPHVLQGQKEGGPCACHKDWLPIFGKGPEGGLPAA